MEPSPFNAFKKFSFMFNLHALLFSHLNYRSQWFSIQAQSCAMITRKFRIFPHKKPRTHHWQSVIHHLPQSTSALVTFCACMLLPFCCFLYPDSNNEVLCRWLLLLTFSKFIPSVVYILIHFFILLNNLTCDMIMPLHLPIY